MACTYTYKGKTYSEEEILRVLQLQSEQIEKEAYDELVTKLKGAGIQVVTIDAYERATGTEVNKDYRGLADTFRGIIAVKRGEASISTLREEAAHMAVASQRDSFAYKQAAREVRENEAYKQNKDAYLEEYQGQEEAVVEEFMGKLMAAHVFADKPSQQKGLVGKLSRLYKAFENAIEEDNFSFLETMKGKRVINTSGIFAELDTSTAREVKEAREALSTLSKFYRGKASIKERSLQLDGRARAEIARLKNIARDIDTTLLAVQQDSEATGNLSVEEEVDLMYKGTTRFMEGILDGAKEMLGSLRQVSEGALEYTDKMHQEMAEFFDLYDVYFDVLDKHFSDLEAKKPTKLERHEGLFLDAFEKFKTVVDKVRGQHDALKQDIVRRELLVSYGEEFGLPTETGSELEAVANELRERTGSDIDEFLLGAAHDDGFIRTFYMSPNNATNPLLSRLYNIVQRENTKARQELEGRMNRFVDRARELGFSPGSDTRFVFERYKEQKTGQLISELNVGGYQTEKARMEERFLSAIGDVIMKDRNPMDRKDLTKHQREQLVWAEIARVEEYGTKEEKAFLNKQQKIRKAWMKRNSELIPMDEIDAYVDQLGKELGYQSEDFNTLMNQLFTEQKYDKNGEPLQRIPKYKEFYVPRASVWRNPEWGKLDENQKALVELSRENIDLMHGEIPSSYRRDGAMPVVYPRTADAVFDKMLSGDVAGFWTGYKRAVKDNFFFNEQELEEAGRMNELGISSKFLPVTNFTRMGHHYMSESERFDEHAKMPDDLFGAIATGHASALRYKHYSQVLRLASDITDVKTQSIPGKDKAATAERSQELIRELLFNESTQEMERQVVNEYGKEGKDAVSMNKIANFIVGRFSQTALMFNLPTAIGSGISGVSQILLELASGAKMQRHAMLAGTAEATREMPHLMHAIWNPNVKSAANARNTFYQIGEGMKQRMRNAKQHRGLYGLFRVEKLGYSALETVDTFIHTSTARAMELDNKIYKGKIIDQYNRPGDMSEQTFKNLPTVRSATRIDANGTMTIEGISKSEQAYFADKVKYVADQMLFKMPPGERGRFRRFLLGNLFMNMRQFLLSAIQSRVGRTTYSDVLRREESGYYTAAWNAGQRIFQDLINDQATLAESWASLPVYQKKYMQRALAETGLIISLMFLARAVQGIADDDEDNWMLNMASYAANRGLQENFSVTPVGLITEGVSVLKSPFASARWMESVVDVSNFTQPFAVLESGPYEGHSRIFKTFSGLALPGHRGYLNTRDIRQTNQYLKGNSNVLSAILYNTDN